MVRTIDFVKKERKAGPGALGLVSAVACCVKSKDAEKKAQKEAERYLCAHTCWRAVYGLGGILLRTS